MFKVLWSEQAEIDLETILLYYWEQAGMRVAEAVYTRIRTQVAILETFPERTRSGRATGTREQVIGRLPYIAIVKVTDEALIILNIIHTAKKYPADTKS